MVDNNYNTMVVHWWHNYDGTGAKMEVVVHLAERRRKTKKRTNVQAKNSEI